MTQSAVPNQGAKPILALLVHIVILLGLTAGLMAGQSQNLATGEAISLVGTVLLVLSTWLLVSWIMSEGSLLNPYGLFLAGSMPFHVGYSLLRFMGHDSMIWLKGRVTEEQLLATLTYVTACYALLHLGALLVSAVASREGDKLRPVYDGTRLYQVGWFLLALSILPLLFRLRASMETVISGGYSSLFEGGGRDPRSGAEGIMALISEFYLPGVMFLLAGSRGRRLGQVVAILGLILYSGSYLFLGFRAFSLIPIAAFVWLWHRTVRRLPVLPVVLTGGALFLFVAPLVRSIRDMSGIDRMSFDVMWEAFAGADNPILKLIAELAGSVLTIAFTAELVPEVRPFEMGYGYLQALANAIPILDLPDAYGYAGSWLAFHVTPSLAVGGFGLGFSFMAEAYMNFGWIGGALMVGLIGAAIAGLQRWADRANDPVRFAFIASFLPILIFFTRGESLSITRPILWYSLIPLVMVGVLRFLDRKIAGVEPEPRVSHPPLRRVGDRLPNPPGVAEPNAWTPHDPGPPRPHDSGPLRPPDPGPPGPPVSGPPRPPHA
ncbi:MAG: O-antigen polysaccharide polymerase Wzy [Rhodothermales bacterium]|nr:O-antigen polysaccharide polymerase Wzy [Rhodothermales bacterium]